MQDEQIIERFKNRDMSALKFVYQSYRREFVRWASHRYSLRDEEAEDIFSDAVIDAYQNVIHGKYTRSGKASFKSYLFEVGKNKALNIINRARISEKHMTVISQQLDDEGQRPRNMEPGNEHAARVQELMELMDVKCRKLLALFYFHDCSMEEIAREMAFKNQDVAKNKKLKCLRRLQHIAFNRYDKSDFFD